MQIVCSNKNAALFNVWVILKQTNVILPTASFNAKKIIATATYKNSLMFYVKTHARNVVFNLLAINSQKKIIAVNSFLFCFRVYIKKQNYLQLGDFIANDIIKHQ